MLRALFLASLLFVSARASSGQALSVLHIKVVVVDAERKATPVPRHVLLISDNPASAPPRRIVTALDGTANVSLRPGNYIVESDRPVAFHGKAYQWTQIVDIAAGRDTVLELTADNADVETVTSATTTSAAALEDDPSFLLPQWQESVVAIWTPNTHASGFVVDAKGLIATNQRVIGTATAVEVQLTPEVKVAARVLAADRVRDVAVLWIDPRVVASVRPVPLGCAQAAKPTVADGQELFTIGVPLRDQKGMTSGTVSRVEPHSITADFMLAPGSAGGPVFTTGGGVVGITSVVDDKDQNGREASRVVRIDNACNVVASAEKAMKDAAPPDPTHLPVDPVGPFPMNALKDAAERRPGSPSPYQMSSSDFDITFITPVHTYGAQHEAEQARGGERNSGSRTPDAEPAVVRPLMDFGNWSEYVADFPPVLLIRVTPKLVEGFWTTVARGAARTQGVSLPPIKHFKSGFSRLRAFCGDTEVRPIHPFKIEQRVSESEAINEGLYVFDPAALGPHCGTVKLVLYSEKEPEKGDVRSVDPKVLQDVWQLFAPYRALKSAAAKVHSAPPAGSQAVTSMSAEARAQLAPNGRLRAALNYGNVLLVSARTPEHTGVAPDLARELARRANATVEFVGYENAGLAADAAKDNAWDVAFIGAEPARAREIAFTPAYVEIEATYLVPAHSPIQTLADVDRDGVRIATAARAAYTLYLQRTLRHATLVEADGMEGSFDLFAGSRVDALAGLKPRLLDDVQKLPGARLLEGRFTAVQQSIGVRHERDAAAAYLTAFVDEIKSSGLLRTIIERHDVRGLSIAAPPPR